MADPIQLLSLELPCNEHAPATVRQALGNAGAALALLQDGLLVASELVTNAVLHSGCEEDHRLRVGARVVDGRLLISVHDPGITRQDATPRWEASAPEATQRPQPSTDGAVSATGVSPGARVGGWGLRIVDQLARRWGSERPDGYCVWAELAPSS